jgi:HSP20 family protein
MTITRWNPMREMLRLRNEFDRFFEDSFDLPGWRSSESFVGPAVDIAETDDAYIVKASIPGIKPDDLDIAITGNSLTIKGQVNGEETIAKENYHLRERHYGAFARTVTLPASVDVESVEAAYEDGVLTLSAPKTEDVKRKRITIKSQEPAKALASKVE